MHGVVYTKKARKDLKSIEVKDAKRIVGKVFYFSQQKDPLKFAKKLKGTLMGEYRFRVGDYRVVFDVDKQGNIKIILILTVKHRKEVYKGT